MYNILEGRIEFKDNHPSRITVLVEMSPGDVRAIFMTTEHHSGYGNLSPSEKITGELFQRVAGFGIESGDRDRDFPNWKKKYQKIA